MEATFNLNKRYTFADYLEWADNVRREIIDGMVKMMTAPSSRHQRISTLLTVRLFNTIEENKGKCEVYSAPFDVRLPKNGEKDDHLIHTVVQPDICVVCDSSKIDDKGCLGAPDMVVEIQSLSTSKIDMNDKFHLYEMAGVREYWVVIPSEGVVVFILQPDGKYDDGTKYDSSTIPVHIFNGIEIELDVKK